MMNACRDTNVSEPDLEGATELVEEKNNLLVQDHAFGTMTVDLVTDAKVADQEFAEERSGHQLLEIKTELN